MTNTTKQQRKKIIILGAGGRDFHNFNVCFRDNPEYEVVAFTATQIPNIESRIYPPCLSGQFYPNGIPIFSENELGKLIKEREVQEVIFSYSDVPHQKVMNLASLALSLGADFRLLSPTLTMLKSKKPVIAICAVRTGCGKSPVSRRISLILRSTGKKIAVIRHPMPYGHLEEQIVQRFKTYKDLDIHKCTIEEREEYEPHIKNGFVVFAGADYEKILKMAEKEADIILWDGGNNDTSFIKPDLLLVVTDPLRPGHELLYHPGETNLRMADAVVINKENDVKKSAIDEVVANIKTVNPEAEIIHARSLVSVDKPELIKNKKVLVIEDGPTATHGEMAFGAGSTSAKKYKAGKIIEPVKWARGTIKKVYKKYPHARAILPAMGYSPQQIKELEETVRAVPCQTVIIATPIDLSRLIKISRPVAKVTYETEEIQPGALIKILKEYKII